MYKRAPRFGIKHRDSLTLGLQHPGEILAEGNLAAARELPFSVEATHHSLLHATEPVWHCELTGFSVIDKFPITQKLQERGAHSLGKRRSLDRASSTSIEFRLCALKFLHSIASSTQERRLGVGCMTVDEIIGG